MEKRIVKFGLGQLDKPMTREQALRYANKNMPGDLRKAGFKATITASDQEIHGSLFYRIQYGK